MKCHLKRGVKRDFIDGNGLSSIKLCYENERNRATRHLTNEKAKLKAKEYANDFKFKGTNFINEYDDIAKRIFYLENDIMRLNNIIEGITVIQKHIKSLSLPHATRRELRRRMLNNLLTDNNEPTAN